MDEPLRGSTRKPERSCMPAATHPSTQGMTVVFVTYDVAEAVLPADCRGRVAMPVQSAKRISHLGGPAILPNRK
jgi:ABC-type nitrate/sulfonate/bicarbonate transport system ATPase subunit